MTLHPDIELVALLGWRCVPAARSKKGLWKGFLDDATSHLETLERWSHEYPGCCWKVVPGGSGIWALDADVPSSEHAADGVAALAELVRRFGPLPPRPHGRSGNGGHLMVFKDVGHAIRCMSGWPQPGLDPRAGRNAFTISPSRSRSGAPYSWLTPPWEVPPPIAPDWLLKAVAPLPQPPPSARPTVSSEGRARRVLARAVERIAHARPGQRNATLNEQAYTAGGLVAAGMLAEQEAVAALYSAGRFAGLDDVECRATIKSGFAAGLNRPLEAQT